MNRKDLRDRRYGLQTNVIQDKSRFNIPKIQFLIQINYSTTKKANIRIIRKLKMPAIASCSKFCVLAEDGQIYSSENSASQTTTPIPTTTYGFSDKLFFVSSGNGYPVVYPRCGSTKRGEIKK